MKSQVGWLIEPNRFLPKGDQQLAMQWEHTVKLGEFRDDGDLLVQWVGIAKLMRPGQRDGDNQYVLLVTSTASDQPISLARIGRPQALSEITSIGEAGRRHGCTCGR